MRFLQIWESILCQMMTVHLASNTQMIQSFDWSNDVKRYDPPFFRPTVLSDGPTNGLLICQYAHEVTRF